MGSKLVHFTVQSFPKMRVIGKTVRVKEPAELDDPTITDLLQAMANDGSFDFLQTLPGQIAQTADTVGWMGDFQPGAVEYTYLAGVLFHPGTPVPEGFVARDIDACDMAVGWIQGTTGEEGGDMFASASGHVQRAVKEHGYEYDGSHGLFEMEYYSYDRFRLPQERGEQPILDFYSPCKKAETTQA